MPFTFDLSDPFTLALIGHAAAAVLAIVFFLVRLNKLAVGLAWLVSAASLLLALLWFLILGGGRKNTHADESIRIALDPNGGLWLTLYIVITLALGWGIRKLVTLRLDAQDRKAERVARSAVPAAD